MYPRPPIRPPCIHSLPLSISLELVTENCCYETDRQLGFFERFDELYWNVTGNNWTFVIERARAFVQLPPGAHVLQKAAYTGPKGAKGKNFVIESETDASISFATKFPLHPGEGFTIVVGWPKGFVREPEEVRKAEEERKKAESRKCFDEFVNKYDVKEWPSMSQLSANPFVYKGKTIAIASIFETMISATEGIFERSNEPFIVSNIPKGLFISKANVVLAGRVLGKKETNLPLLGAVLVPHLKFVGVHFCKDERCGDIIVE